jgi:hypothetical protein
MGDYLLSLEGAAGLAFSQRRDYKEPRRMAILFFSTAGSVSNNKSALPAIYLHSRGSDD